MPPLSDFANIARVLALSAVFAFAGAAARAQTSEAPTTPAPVAPADPAAPAAPDAQAAPDASAGGDSQDQSIETSAAVPVTLAARPALVFSGSAEWEEGLHSITDSFDKIRAEMGKAGLQPGGRPIAVFTDTDDQGFRYQAMLPLVAKPEGDVALGQGVVVGSTPPGKTMKFEHRGSYDDIDTTYEAITAYLDEKGLEAQNLFVEEYLTTPKGIDDSDLEVDIYVFLK